MENTSKLFSWKKKLSMLLIGAGFGSYYGYRKLAENNPKLVRK